MKKLLAVSILTILTFNLVAVPTKLDTSNLLIDSNGLVFVDTNTPASASITPPNTAVKTDAGAVLKPNATQNSAVHSNFNISSAWLSILVPLIIAGIKLLIPKIPGAWLPILAPALGALGDVITSYINGSTPNPGLGALFGSAGVGVREVVNQIKLAAVAKAVTPPTTPPIVAKPLDNPPKV